MHRKAVLTPCGHYLLATLNLNPPVTGVCQWFGWYILGEQQRVLWCSAAVCWQRRNKGDAVSTNSAQRQETWYSSSRHGLNLEGGRVCTCVCDINSSEHQVLQGHTLHRRAHWMCVCFPFICIFFFFLQCICSTINHPRQKQVEKLCQCRV